MKIFAASLLAHRVAGGEINIRAEPAILIASSNEEAKGKGINYLNVEFPSADGWSKEASVIEITADLIDELIRSQEMKGGDV